MGVTYPPGLIGVLTRPTGLTASWPCLIQLEKPAGTKHAVVTGTAIPKARNQIVDTLLSQSELEWVLFVDDDQVFPPDALTRLLDSNVPVVGAVIAGKYAPFQPWVFFEAPPDEAGHKMLRRASNEEVASARGLTRVAAIGTGFTLIDRSVFEQVTKPWFENAPLATEGVGEDIFFSLKAQEKGFGVWAQMDLKVGHLTVMSVVLNDEGQPTLTHDRFMRRQTIT